jgi:glutamine synthetase
MSATGPVKRAEWSDYRRYVSPWERERYGE